ncbi:MAG: hypothetical protein ABR538_12060 [Candidatus Binatia bacterium]
MGVGAARGAPPRAVVPCGAFSLIPNSSFQTNISFWDATAGAAWSPQDSSGSPTSGSVELTVSDVASAALSQCVPVVGGERYMLDVSVLIQVPEQAEGEAGAIARWHADENCTQELPDPPSGTLLTSAPEWTAQVLTPTSPVQAVAALLEVRATKTGGSEGSSFTANLDNVFFAFLGSPDCGDPICSYHGPSSSDALFILRGAVGWFDCNACHCDVDASGNVTTSDALAVLRASVELPATLACPVCG